jgi:hypothetical protein
MANKKINELDSRATLTLSDLMAVGDPSTGYLYKTTISDLKTLTGAGVVSFNGRIGSVVPAEGDYTLTQLSDVIITSASNNQVLRYNGSNWVNATIDLSGYVPYTGATANVNLGTFDLTADVITGATGSFASSGGSNTFAINHSSGSGIALSITKGGNGEGIYINKTSGSGNAATIVGTLEATTLVKTGGTSSQFLKADGSVDSSTYLTTASAASTYVPLTRTLTINGTAYDLSANRTWTIPTHDAVTIGTANGLSLSGQALSLALASTSATGALSSTDWNTFNSKQATITLTTTGSSGSSTLVGATLNIPTYTLAGLGGQPALSGTGFVKISGTTISYDNSTYLTTASAASTYVALAGTQTISGEKTFTNGITSFAMYTSDETKSVVPGGVSSLTTLYVSGDLIIDTNTLYVDSTNNRVGISTTSPLSKLHVAGTGTVVRFGEESGTTGKQLLFGVDSASGRGEIQAVWQGTANTPLGLNPAGGNVLIGTTTDNGERLQVSGSVINTGYFITPAAATTGGVSGFLNQYNAGNASSRSWRTTNDLLVYGDFAIQQSTTQTGSTYANQLYFNATGAATFSSSVTAVGNINIQDSSVLNLGYNQGGGATLKYNSNGNLDITPRSGYNTNFTSGNVEFGTTGLNGRLGIYYGLTSKVGIDMRDSDDASNAYFLFFRKSNGTGIGSIQRAGLTDATLYNTTSDYRLKEDFKQINGLDKISKIKVYDFKWKGLEDRMDGVIAHELQEIMPYAVSGQKDGENMQAVDYSKIVPILVKAIQEQQAQIEDLKAKIK